MNDGDVALHEDRSREKLSLISKSDFMEEDLQPMLNECSQEVLVVYTPNLSIAEYLSPIPYR